MVFQRNYTYNIIIVSSIRMRLKKNDKYIVLNPPVRVEQNEYASSDYREKVIAACRLYKFMTLRRRDGENYSRPFLSRNLIYQSNTNKITFDMAQGLHDPPLVFKVIAKRKQDRRDDIEKRNQLDELVKNLANRSVIQQMNSIKVEDDKPVLKDFCDLVPHRSEVERACKHLNIASQKELLVKDGYIVGQNAEINRDQFSDYVSISEFSFQRNQKRCYCHFKLYMNYIFHDGRQVTEEIKNGEFRRIFPIETPCQIDLPSPKKMRISTKEAKLLIKVRTALIQDLSEPLTDIPSLPEMEMPGFFRAEYFASRTIWTNSSPLQYDYSNFAMNVVHVKNLRPGFIYEERQYDIYSRDLMNFENPAIIGKIAKSRADVLSLLVPTKPLYSDVRVRKCTKNCGRICQCSFANGILNEKSSIKFVSDFTSKEERIQKLEISRNPEGDDMKHIGNLLNISKRIENESSDEEEYVSFQYSTPTDTKKVKKANTGSAGSTRSKGKRPTSRNSGSGSGSKRNARLSGTPANPRSKKSLRKSNSSRTSKNVKSLKLKKGSGVTKVAKDRSAKQSNCSKNLRSANSIKKSGSSLKRNSSSVNSESPFSKKSRTETTPLWLRRSSRFNDSRTHSPDDTDFKCSQRSRSRQSLKQENETENDDDEEEEDEEENEVDGEEDEEEEEEEEEKLEQKEEDEVVQGDLNASSRTDRLKLRLYFDIYSFLGKYPAENGKYVNQYRFLQSVFCKSFLLSKHVISRMRCMFINVPEIFLFYRFVGANSSEPPGTKIYEPIMTYEHRSCHVENLYTDTNPFSFMKLRPMIPQKCIICDKTFDTTFTLLLHYNLNYPRLRFSYAIGKTEKLSKSMITQIDVSLNPYYKEGNENRSISIGKEATQTVPFFAVTPWHTRTIRNNMRMDLTMFAEGLSFTDIKSVYRK